MITEPQVIEFSISGLDLLEPNVFLTDLLLGVFCLSYGIRIFRVHSKHPFFKNWVWFFCLFGLAAVFGGMGHLFANYWGIYGKMPAWILSAFAVYAIESAMFSLLRNKDWLGILTRISRIKLIFILLLVFLFASLATPDIKVDLCIQTIIINSLTGVSFAAGILGWSYYRLGFSRHFRRIATGVLIIIPSSAVFLLEFNIFRWFDRNDLSHFVLYIGITAFYQAIMRLLMDQPAVLRPAISRD